MGVGAPKRVYIDTNIVIYQLQGVEAFRTQLASVGARIDAGIWQAHTSHLTLCEAMVRPMQETDKTAIEKCRSFILESGLFSLVALSLDVLERSARVRAEHGLKLADAIHVACAMSANCTAFLTNDRRLRVPPSMQLLQLNEIDD